MPHRLENQPIYAGFHGSDVCVSNGSRDATFQPTNFPMVEGVGCVVEFVAITHIVSRVPFRGFSRKRVPDGWSGSSVPWPTFSRSTEWHTLKIANQSYTKIHLYEKIKMKTQNKLCLLMLGLMVAITGCDAAKEKANQAKEKAKDMAGVDFGDFDIKGMKDKFAGITDGFKDVSADNVDGLKTKLTDLTGSIDTMGIGDLKGTAKTAAGGVMSKFGEAIKGAMGGITDEGILSKLKPAVGPLMEKLNAFK